MSRTLSPTALRAVLAQQTSECFVILIELSHASMAAPIRVNSSGRMMTHDGDVYVYFPFEVEFPNDTDGKISQAKLTIDNTDREIVLAVRSVGGAPIDVNIKCVLDSTPDVIEAQYSDFKLVNVVYDANQVQGDLTIENFVNEPYPAGRFTPSLFPGLY